MTNKDLTLIAALVDRSGSMHACQKDMQGGLNSFIEQQAKEPGDAEIVLAHFDHEYSLVWPIKPLTSDLKYSLIPRGNTALFDAVGRFVTEVGEQLRGPASPNAASPSCWVWTV